jgi:hypothetical protein
MARHIRERKMKLKTILAVAVATAAILSLALGAAFTLTTGSPAAFIGGLALFLAFAGFAATLNPTI